MFNYSIRINTLKLVYIIFTEVVGGMNCFDDEPGGFSPHLALATYHTNLYFADFVQSFKRDKFFRADFYHFRCLEIKPVIEPSSEK